MLRAYKTELDFNNRQRTAFLKHAGAARFVYNWALADRIARYKATGKSTNVYEQKRRFNALKHDEFPWLGEVAYVIVQEAFSHLDIAYKNFFRRSINGSDKGKGFPKFKSRHKGIGSFTVRGKVHVEEGRIKLPRIGWVRLKENGYLPGNGVKILKATISERAGRWFVSLQVEKEATAPKPMTGNPIGVDLGVKERAVCSNGKVFENPNTLYRHEKRLARVQRELSRRQKGSKNRTKTKRKVARLHYRIACIRQHDIHEATTYLTAKVKPSAIVVEDLNVTGMMQNRHLSKSVADASMSEFRRQLTYKCEWNGIDLLVADRWYPSSKTCSGCGNVKPLLKLSERTYVCDSCDLVIDRDLNAARNLAELAVKPTVAACGERAESGPSVKQEPGSQVVVVSPGGNP